MRIDPAKLDPLEAYKLATSVVVPRPIAWVGTRSKDGVDNLAPFSYFMGVSTKPPSLAISVARGRGGVLKDTAKNIVETGVFTVSIVSYALAEQMVATGKSWPSDESEFAVTGLTPVDAETIEAPRPSEALVSMECSLVHAHDMGSTHLLVGEVSIYHLDDTVVVVDAKGHRTVDLAVLDPIGRLGAYDYCRVRDIFSLKAQK
jgi:flavin reductase (DIM6/NTAB) family NADH-FMN oxidoreductase RutF